jgi:hypothetical protein
LRDKTGLLLLLLPDIDDALSIFVQLKRAKLCAAFHGNPFFHLSLSNRAHLMWTRVAALMDFRHLNRPTTFARCHIAYKFSTP